MDVPQSFPGTLVGGALVVGAGVAVGAAAGHFAQAGNGPGMQRAGAAAAGFVGGMLAGVAGLAAGIANPRYEKVGQWGALLSFGAVTGLAALAMVRPGGVFDGQSLVNRQAPPAVGPTQGPPPPPSAPSTAPAPSTTAPAA